MDSDEKELSSEQLNQIHGYYLALRQFCEVTGAPQDRSSSSRAQKARAKLLKLPAGHFLELSTDVHDELQRRIDETQQQPNHLLPKKNFHDKRNQAREKLANLSQMRFGDLVDDIIFEIRRRGYHVKVRDAYALRESDGCIAPEGRAEGRGKTSIVRDSPQGHHRKSQEESGGAVDVPDQSNVKSPSRQVKRSSHQEQLENGGKLGENFERPSRNITENKYAHTAQVIPKRASIDWSTDDEDAISNNAKTVGDRGSLEMNGKRSSMYKIDENHENHENEDNHVNDSPKRGPTTPRKAMHSKSKSRASGSLEEESRNVRELKELNERLEVKVKDLANQVLKLAGENQTLRDQLKETINLLEDTRSELQMQRLTAKQENITGDIKQQLENLNGQLYELTLENEALQRKNLTMTLQLADNDQTINGTHIDGATAKIAALKGQLLDLISENKSLKLSKGEPKPRKVEPAEPSRRVNENYEKEMSLITSQLNELSIQNESLQQLNMELGLKVKFLTGQLAKSNGNQPPRKGPAFDLESISKYIKSEGLIPLSHIRHFNFMLETIFNHLGKGEKSGEVLFEDIARVSDAVESILKLISDQPYSQETILIKAATSQAITAIRYYAKSPTILPVFAVESALTGISFTICNLVGVAGIEQHSSYPLFNKPESETDLKDTLTRSEKSPESLIDDEGILNSVKPLRIIQRVNSLPQVDSSSSLSKLSGTSLISGKMTDGHESRNKRNLTLPLDGNSRLRTVKSSSPSTLRHVIGDLPGTSDQGGQKTTSADEFSITATTDVIDPSQTNFDRALKSEFAPENTNSELEDCVISDGIPETPNAEFRISEALNAEFGRSDASNFNLGKSISQAVNFGRSEAQNSKSGSLVEPSINYGKLTAPSLNFSSSEAPNVSFGESEDPNGDVERSVIQNVNFGKPEAPNSNFERSEAQDVSFQESEGTDSGFERSEAPYSNFSRSEMQNVSFGESEGPNSDFERSQAPYSNFGRPDAHNFSFGESETSNADFESSEPPYSNLGRPEAQNANSVKAEIPNAGFEKPGVLNPQFEGEAAPENGIIDNSIEANKDQSPKVSHQSLSSKESLSSLGNPFIVKGPFNKGFAQISTDNGPEKEEATSQDPAIISRSNLFNDRNNSMLEKSTTPVKRTSFSGLRPDLYKDDYNSSESAEFSSPSDDENTYQALKENMKKNRLSCASSENSYNLYPLHPEGPQPEGTPKRDSNTSEVLRASDFDLEVISKVDSKTSSKHEIHSPSKNTLSEEHEMESNAVNYFSNDEANKSLDKTSTTARTVDVNPIENSTVETVAAENEQPNEEHAGPTEASSEVDFNIDEFDIENPDNTLSQLLLYLEYQTMDVICTIQSLLTSIKEPKATAGNLRYESSAISQVIGQMVDATSIAMNQTRNATLKEHGNWVVKSLSDCRSRMIVLCNLTPEGLFATESTDSQFADKHFKQRLAGVAFDVAKCTKELVKTVEEESLKEEIEYLDSKLQKK
ncbi:HHL182Wp [Eremothecium sinecaudum]|uniref:HHL182Wp n=1 Tax=Eremothecium sinecaudum TaxID=45286 RepID=A0A109V087_9SACH|nr:HHL182Wp [Eremothecium sinecaudum]AMD22588.1 HHL182Wp [Eremothecium sinecaudum]